MDYYLLVSRHPSLPTSQEVWQVHSRHRSVRAARAAYARTARGVRAACGQGSYLPGLGIAGVDLPTSRRPELGPEDCWTWEAGS